MKNISLMLIAFCFITHSTGATELIFEPATIFAPLPPTYGNRVNSTTQSGFHYGTAGGFTPNVQVTYSGSPKLWPADYGDLNGVMYSGGGSNMDITFTADPGFQVQLLSFDMACWPHRDLTMPGLQILDGNNNPLFSQFNVTIQGDDNGPSHSSFVFSDPLTAPTLRLRLLLGDNFVNESVGIDNITFAQVPEPATLSLAALGAMILGGALLRRRRSRP